MRREIEEILTLQSGWTSTNTPEMAMRGNLIRRELPRSAQSIVDASIDRMPVHLRDLRVEGRDGTGLKSEVPWTRVFSQSRSPSATEGWYLVYLFDAFGEAAYLSINQGTTQWDRGEFRPRPADELVERARWARALLRDDVPGRRDLLDEISLPTRNSQLAKQYEFGNVFAIRYDAAALPLETTLRADLSFMVELLSLLYEYLDNSLVVPGDPSAEIQDAVDLADLAAGRSRLRGGYRLDVAERKAIELRAVESASVYLSTEGYKLRDVGNTHSYDLHARRGDETLFVEVKGTVSSGSEIVLTKNEVALHADVYPKNMLAVLSDIELDRSGIAPIARGGRLTVWSPWKIDEMDLTPLSFSYRTPSVHPQP